MIRERYRDPALPLEARVDALLELMNVDEKLAQLTGVWATDLLEQKRFSRERADRKLSNGTGHLTRLAAATGLRPAESAALANEIQAYLTENTRLGIPAIVHEESCGGYMARDATCFPQAIGQASTWEPDLIEAMSTVIRNQMRPVGAHHSLAPVLDVTRDPRWGRVEETFGEDPYLVTRIGVAYIKGLQGPRLEDGVIATAKHFVGYGMSEGGLNWAPAHIMPRELREVFAAPFEAAIEEAGVASVMNAYHEMDGIPLGSSRQLMVELLRERLGFEGVVVSDYFTVPMLVAYHRVARDKTEAAKLALEAGIDVELPAADCYGDPLREGLEQGLIEMALVDASVRRVLEQKFRLGLFEDPFVDAPRAPLLFDTAEQRALSRRIAQKSIVLLKNDAGALPLAKDLSSIALVGPGADDVRLLQGDYHYPAHQEVMFEAQGDLPAPTPMLAADVAALDDHYPQMVSVLQGIQSKLGPATRVNRAKGCGVTETSTEGFAEAIEAARGSEVAVVVVGDRSGLTDDATSGEARDRAEIGLPGVQEALVEAIVDTGTPVVLVLLGGRPLALPTIYERVAAALVAWLPGEEGGNAVADVLFGDYNPGGKLPISIPRSAAQIPVYYNHKPSGNRSHWKGDYVDMPTAPLYPFGHGLSYATFEYRDLRIERGEVAAGGRVSTSFELRNAGEREGDEVTQLYLHGPPSNVTRPVKELKGFKRLTLAPGESKRVTFDLAVEQLGFYDREMRFCVEPGWVEVMIGSSSADIRLKGGFEVTGERFEVQQKVFSTVVALSEPEGAVGFEEQ
jgi:beta-glucosidase